MAKAAQALGYDFTVADMEKANAEARELDPEEIEQAAGGLVLCGLRLLHRLEPRFS